MRPPTHPFASGHYVAPTAAVGPPDPPLQWMQQPSEGDWNPTFGQPASPTVDHRPPYTQEKSNTPNDGSQMMRKAVVGMVMDSMVDNMGITQTQVSQLQNWFPQTVILLKQYFDVSHQLVGNKILVLLFPFMRILWGSGKGRGRSDYTSGSSYNHSLAHGDHSPENQKRPPVDRPDLYIPLMALVTYLLLVGLTKGHLNEFHPEVLRSTASYAFAIQSLEIIVAKAGFYCVQGNRGIGFLDFVAFTGYKYVSLAMLVAVRLLVPTNDSIYWASFFYTTSCSAVGMHQSLKHAGLWSSDFGDPTSSWQPVTRRSITATYFSWLLAFAQVPLCWVLIPRP
eukprot:Selendium_serpulae@DN3955_c0_g1_i1.p1